MDPQIPESKSWFPGGQQESHSKSPENYVLISDLDKDKNTILISLSGSSKQNYRKIFCNTGQHQLRHQDSYIQVKKIYEYLKNQQFLVDYKKGTITFTFDSIQRIIRLHKIDLISAEWIKNNLITHINSHAQKYILKTNHPQEVFTIQKNKIKSKIQGERLRKKILLNVEIGKMIKKFSVKILKGQASLGIIDKNSLTDEKPFHWELKRENSVQYLGGSGQIHFRSGQQNVCKDFRNITEGMSVKVNVDATEKTIDFTVNEKTFKCEEVDILGREKCYIVPYFQIIEQENAIQWEIIS